jgi:hypothetical protein
MFTHQPDRPLCLKGPNCPDYEDHGYNEQVDRFTGLCARCLAPVLAERVVGLTSDYDNTAADMLHAALDGEHGTELVQAMIDAQPRLAKPIQRVVESLAQPSFGDLDAKLAEISAMVGGK